MQMLMRLAVVLLAWGLSLFGLMGLLIFAGAGLASWPGRLVVLLWLFALGSHMHLAQAWVRRRTVNPAWPRRAVWALVASLLSPVVLLAANSPRAAGELLVDGAGVSALTLMLFLPAVLLTLWLAHHHRQRGD